MRHGRDIELLCNGKLIMKSAGKLYGKVWSEREYIVVLYEYMKHHENAPCKTQSYVQHIASLLGRTPAAVAMRMANFASLDGIHGKKLKGLAHVSPLCRRIFDNWTANPDALEMSAESIIRDEEKFNQPNLFEPQPIRMPRAFGKYELLDHIADGGFGSVYHCINSDDGREYALKIVLTDRIHDREALGRFRREIRAMKEIEHPHVMRIFEDNLEEESHYPGYVMELAYGSLIQHLDSCAEGLLPLSERPIPDRREAVSILSQVFDAVEALHSAERVIIHRDINPNNILQLDDERWVLADFGLAKFLSSLTVSATFQTQANRGAGTPTYTAPEQYKDFSNTSVRCDVYSMGVLIWELFSTAWGTPRYDMLGLPEPLEAVYSRATMYDPENRYQTIIELRIAFEEAMEKLGTEMASSNG